jgi:hypothetical protein
MDRITLPIALETDVWMAIYTSEPSREINVEMRYKDLVAIRKLIVRYCEEQSKVDLIHPIRCKDCKHHGEQYGNGYCMKDGCYGWYDTDYCSRAERKEE